MTLLSFSLYITDGTFISQKALRIMTVVFGCSETQSLMFERNRLEYQSYANGQKISLMGKSLFKPFLKLWIEQICILDKSKFFKLISCFRSALRILINWFWYIQQKYQIENIQERSELKKNQSSFLCSLEVGNTRNDSCQTLTIICVQLPKLHQRSQIQLSPKINILVLIALSLNVILLAIFLMFWTIKSTETRLFLKPGMMISAQTAVGRMKSLKAFFTNLLYCYNTLITLLPLSVVSLLSLRQSLISSKLSIFVPSQLMNILYVSKSLILLSWKAISPSKKMILAGPTKAGSFMRACSMKEYCGMATLSELSLRLMSVLQARSKSKALG